MGNFHQPVPAFLDSLSSEMKLQGAGTSVKGQVDFPMSIFVCAKHNCLFLPSTMEGNIAIVSSFCVSKGSLHFGSVGKKIITLSTSHIITMGLTNNDPLVELHMSPQQVWR